MKTLVKNTIINIGAFGLVSLINLLVISFIVAAYGPAEYGLIVLVRILLPTGIVGLFDLGLAEAVTRYIASSHAEGSDEDMSRIMMTAILIVFAVAGLVSGVIFVFSGEMVRWFSVELDKAEQFQWLIRSYAIALLILFPGLICESAVKGLEKFYLVRLAEIISMLVFTLLVVYLIAYKYAYLYIAYAYLVTAALRSVFFLGYVICGASVLRMKYFGVGEVTRKMMGHAFTIFQGKSVSAIFNNVAHILIGLLFGSYAVGVYDVLLRLPRFVKMIFGLINSAILPASAVLEAKKDKKNMVFVLEHGTIFTLSISFPFMMGMMLFSEPILRIWVGEQYASQGVWLALFFMWPGLVSIVGIGTSMLVARKSALRKLNYLSWIQLLLFMLISLTAQKFLGFQAFILGIISALIVVVPLQIRVITKEYLLNSMFYLATIFRVLIAGLFPLAWYILVSILIDQRSVYYLVIGLLGWCSIYWLSLYYFVYTEEQKRYVKNITRIFR